MRTLLILMVAVMAAGGCTGGNEAADTPPSSTPSLETSPAPAGVPESAELFTLEERTEAELSIAGEPDWMTEGFGSIWVSRTDPEGEGNMLDRVDPATNEVLASIEVGRNPCHGVEAAFGAVWVPTCIDQALVKVDPDSNEVDATIEVPLSRTDGNEMTSGEGALWIAVTDPDGGFALARIDPRSHDVDLIELPSEGQGALAAFGSVWVAAPAAGAVYRLDPRSLEITDTMEGLAEPQFLAAGAESVWVSNYDGTLVTIDPATGEAGEPIAVGTDGLATSMAVEDGSVWFRPSNYVLGRLDEDTGAITEAFVEPPSVGDLVVAFDSLWFAEYTKDTVWRLSI